MPHSRRRQVDHGGLGCLACTDEVPLRLAPWKLRQDLVLDLNLWSVAKAGRPHRKATEGRLLAQLAAQDTAAADFHFHAAANGEHHTVGSVSGEKNRLLNRQILHRHPVMLIRSHNGAGQAQAAAGYDQKVHGARDPSLAAGVDGRLCRPCQADLAVRGWKTHECGEACRVRALLPLCQNSMKGRTMVRRACIHGFHQETPSALLQLLRCEQYLGLFVDLVPSARCSQLGKVCIQPRDL
mmetsp:Transcript_9962/g.23608  ORF Transcript_9962/g.23608 Transcript_9962/m.23608 type:complete len:239 (-) Transcript_9962:285-1001(-)